jgi:hypothetical protein
MSAILGIASSIFKFFTGMLDVALKWASIFFAYRLGKRKAQQEALERAVEVKDEQLKIGNRPPLHRDELIARMLKRKRKQ